MEPPANATGCGESSPSPSKVLSQDEAVAQTALTKWYFLCQRPQLMTLIRHHLRSPFTEPKVILLTAEQQLNTATMRNLRPIKDYLQEAQQVIIALCEQANQRGEQIRSDQPIPAATLPSAADLLKNKNLTIHRTGLRLFTRQIFAQLLHYFNNSEIEMLEMWMNAESLAMIASKRGVSIGTVSRQLAILRKTLSRIQKLYE